MSRGLDANLAPYVDQKWIENINILLVRRSSRFENGYLSQFNYQVCVPESDQIVFTTGFFEYFGKRPKRAYLPNDVLRACDFEPEWRPFLPANLDHLSPLSNVPILTQNLTRANILKKAKGEAEILPSDIALRIAALRCIFVKTGILLIEPLNSLKPTNSPKTVKKLLKKYQEKVRTKPEEFLSLLKELQDYSLRLSSINEWWNWISPTTVGKIPRYDTIFYFCAVDPGDSTQNILQTDFEQNWIFLDRFLAQYHCEKPSFVVLPSQLYELMRLANHKEYSELKRFASERELLGVEQWIPSVSIYADGCVSTLPGDYQYPPKVEMIPSKTARFHDNKSMKEFVDRDKELNRIEHRSYWCKIIVQTRDDRETQKQQQQHQQHHPIHNHHHNPLSILDSETTEEALLINTEFLNDDLIVNDSEVTSSYLKSSLGHWIPLQIDSLDRKEDGDFIKNQNHSLMAKL